MDLRSTRRRAPTANHGLSLIEVLIVMAIAAILLAIGVPNMQNFIVANRLATATQDLYTALNFARSEAVRRGTRVALAHHGAAGSRNFTGGWTMFVDANGNGAHDAGEEVLRVGAALEAPMTAFGSANFGDFIAFDATGRLPNSGGGSLVLCHGAALVADGQSRVRALAINAAGRVRMALDSDADLVPETDTGPVPNCTNS